MGRGRIEQRDGREVIVEHHVGKFKDAPALAGDQLRIARTGADEVDLSARSWRESAGRSEGPRGGARPAPPSGCLSRRGEQVRRNFGADGRGVSLPAWLSARISLAPSGVATTAIILRRPASTVAYAPMGTWHPPPRARRAARSASTDARVAASSKARQISNAPPSARVSMARGLCLTWC